MAGNKSFRTIKSNGRKCSFIWQKVTLLYGLFLDQFIRELFFLTNKNSFQLS